MSSNEVPVVSREEDIAALDGQKVRVVGCYEQIDVRMNPKPPPRYSGHVSIKLDDGTKVLLYPVWDKRARRDQNEIAQCEGKQVEATGVLHATAPESDETVANLELPCLTGITSIHIVNEGKA
ncbi:MAG TPA: hypothetical protein VNG11_05965 [Chloroflexota bacterium]|nr:hypothetical protein [Chloroflexota bacterium]